MMDQQQTEYNIYFQGSKEHLFSMLYPLTGPESPIFSHLEIEHIAYSQADKNLEFAYKTKEFSNIDRQNEPVVYASQSVPTHSNYFYSTFVGEKDGFVWRSVDRMMELRPVQVGHVGKHQKDKERQKEKGSQERMMNEVEEQGEPSYTQLNLITTDDDGNHVLRQIESAPSSLKLNRNWDISKEEYAARLCE